jgi:hypothetical protein
MVGHDGPPRSTFGRRSSGLDAKEEPPIVVDEFTMNGTAGAGADIRAREAPKEERPTCSCVARSECRKPLQSQESNQHPVLPTRLAHHIVIVRPRVPWVALLACPRHDLAASRHQSRTRQES